MPPACVRHLVGQDPLGAAVAVASPETDAVEEELGLPSDVRAGPGEALGIMDLVASVQNMFHHGMR
jgi:hypothetical protein